MSYTVLSLKWRPQSFQDLVGQDHVVKTITNAFRQDRVSQAYLLTGPRGVGKTTCARLIAKALNCAVSPGNPCNSCENCHEITEGRSMDVLEIDGASNRGIEEIRNLREVIKYAPMNAPYKVFIIDEVHMLTIQAFNALLRTLEEPPAHGKFILATTDVHKVPSTIISRCQRFDFNRITSQVIMDRLAFILSQEKIGYDDNALLSIAQKADGSMRDALSVLDQIIAFADGNITLDLITDVLGLIPSTLFFDILDALKNRDGAAVLDQVQHVQQNGTPVADFARGIRQHLRNLMYCKFSGGEKFIEAGADLIKEYQRQAGEWETGDLIRMAEEFSHLSNQIRYASHPYLLLEMNLIKILEMPDAVSLAAILSGKTNLPKPVVRREKKKATRTKSASVPAPAISVAKPEASEPVTKPATAKPTSEPTPESAPVPEARPGENKSAKQEKPMEDLNPVSVWGTVVEKVSAKKRSLAATLEQTRVLGIDKSRLKVELVGHSKFDLDFLEKNRELLEKSIAEYCGRTLRLDISFTRQNTAESASESQKATPTEDSGTVSKIIELFDGEIIR
ncbi:MAG: DNA polymerase III subunit gamma/tau [Fidelibacterota bacterium]